MKNLKIIWLLHLITFISFYSCESSSPLKKEHIHDKNSYKEIDTIHISDSVYLIINFKKKDEISITRSANEKRMDIHLYKNGDLKRVSYYNDLRYVKKSEGEEEVQYNIQTLDLDEKGNVKYFYLSKNFERIASSND